jgi:DNA topoisomerase-2
MLFLLLAYIISSADERKDWINRYQHGTYLDHKKEKVPIHDFVDKELVLYAIASNQRALPSVIDGLKHGHRKIMFSCFKRNLVKGIIKTP